MICSLASMVNVALAGPVIVLLFKVTVLLGLAALGAAAMRRRAAATRHFVWAVALGATLALPILGSVSPQVEFPLPSALEKPLRAWLQGPRAASGTASNASVARAVMSIPPAANAGSATGPAGATGAGGELHATVAGRQSTGAGDGSRSRSQRWLALVWLAGSVAVLSRLGLGHLGLVRLARGARPLANAAWRSLLHDALAQGHLATDVRLCCSPNVGAPVTWGWTPAVVVLPAGVERWPMERRRAALAHELAHVARRDYVTQLAAALVCAVYWFHPLVWFAARRLRVESEHACDDRVLTGGTSAPDYATHLLAIARGARRLRLAGAVAVCMARPSHLEGRLLALLDDARPRGPLTARMRIATLVLLGLLAIPFVGLHPVARAAKTPTDSRQDPPRITKAGTDVGLEMAPIAEDSRSRSSTHSESRSEETSGDSASTLRKSLNASPGERLTLDLETGGDVELRGWDENRVEVRARLDGADWRDTQVDVEREDGGVRVTSRLRHDKGWSSTSHALEIRVPRRFDLQLHSAGGGVTIAGVEGRFRGQTGGGDIVLEHVQGDVRLSTGGGEIRVTDVDARGSVTTGGGMVWMSRVRGGLQGSSGSGPVIYSEGKGESAGSSHARSEKHFEDLEGVRVDGENIEDTRTDGQGVLHIQKAGGDVVLREAPYGVHITTGGGRIRVGRSGGTVEAKTGGGDIEIGPVAGSVVAGTGAGDVEVTLSDVRDAEQTVEIASGKGRIVVELPKNFDGEFDLETAYTSTPTRIESTWKLDREPTTDWDDSEGTPRRYVRAHGVAGHGRGLVHVRTVNGDIVLRRGRGGR